MAACAAPSAAANVWPRVSHMLEQGAASGTEVGITLALIMSALGMAAIPFAMKKATNLGFWLVCLGFGLGLAGFNYSMAVDLAGHWRDQATAPAAQTAAEAEALKSRVARATAAKSELPHAPHTTAAQVTAAEEAVKLAEQARVQECDKIGDNCRARVAELKTATETRAVALANRGVTEKRERYEAEIDTAQKQLDGLGPVSEVVDPTAVRIGKVLSSLPFVDMGPRPDLTFIEWWPTWVAVVIEAIGLIGPRVILTAVLPADAPRAPRQLKLTRLWARRRGSETLPASPPSASPSADVAAPASAVADPAPVKTAATPATPKRARKVKVTAVADESSVRQWKECRTITRTGSELRPKETYDKSYVPWCSERNIEPVSFTRFGLLMKASVENGGCGVVYVERNKRGFYVGLALVGAPKLVSNERSLAPEPVAVATA